LSRDPKRGIEWQILEKGEQINLKSHTIGPTWERGVCVNDGGNEDRRKKYEITNSRMGKGRWEFRTQ